MLVAARRQSSVIPHIECQSCGQPMRLAKVEPSNEEGRDIYSYDCECGFLHQQTEVSDRASVAGGRRSR
jgi:hypothetical protein